LVSPAKEELTSHAYNTQQYPKRSTTVKNVEKAKPPLNFNSRMDIKEVKAAVAAEDYYDEEYDSEDVNLESSRKMGSPAK